MTLTFITNSLTHHTAPLADALSGWLGTDFHFVETKPLRQERIQLGWQQGRTGPTSCGLMNARRPPPGAAVWP